MWALPHTAQPSPTLQRAEPETWSRVGKRPLGAVQLPLLPAGQVRSVPQQRLLHRHRVQQRCGHPGAGQGRAVSLLRRLEPLPTGCSAQGAGPSPAAHPVRGRGGPGAPTLALGCVRGRLGRRFETPVLQLIPDTPCEERPVAAVSLLTPSARMGSPEPAAKLPVPGGQCPAGRSIAPTIPLPAVSLPQFPLTLRRTLCSKPLHSGGTRSAARSPRAQRRGGRAGR